ncbi:MAG TPA: hypothetical protein VIJ96_01800 [Acidothermaceae bacterium]
MHSVAIVHTVARRDFWDWAISVSTLVATTIAVIALIVAIRARSDLVHERRADFNLNVLRELADEVELAAGTEVGMNTPKIRVRLRMLRDAIDAPWMLTLAGIKPDPIVENFRAEKILAISSLEGEQRRFAQHKMDDLDRENVLREVQEVIRKELASRPNRKVGLPWRVKQK